MVAGHEPTLMVTASRDVMRHVTGDDYSGCPWRVFSDPYVIDVLRAYAFFESGQLGFYSGTDPSNVLAEGLRHYHVTLNRIHADEMDRDRKKRSLPVVPMSGPMGPPPKPPTVAAGELKIIGVGNG